MICFTYFLRYNDYIYKLLALAFANSCPFFNQPKKRRLASLKTTTFSKIFTSIRDTLLKKQLIKYVMWYIMPFTSILSRWIENDIFKLLRNKQNYLCNYCMFHLLFRIIDNFFKEERNESTNGFIAFYHEKEWSVR